MKKESKLKSALKGWAAKVVAPKRKKAALHNASARATADENSLHLRIGASVATPSMAQVLKSYRLTGDAKWSALIYKAQWHLVLGCAQRLLGNREDAEDAAAEVFGKVLERLRLETPDNLGGWLYVITRHHCFELQRKQKRSPIMESIEAIRFVMDESGPYLPDEKEAWLVPAVHRALDCLPAHQSICIRRFYLEDKSYQEISDTEGFTVKEIKSYLQNGRRRLMQLLAPVRDRHVSDACVHIM